ncbi:MAG: serine hydrolase domain-containing protein [Bacteroidota bacterium]
MRKYGVLVVVGVVIISFFYLSAIKSDGKENFEYEWKSTSKKSKIHPSKNPHLYSFVKNYENWFSHYFDSTNVPGSALCIIKDTTILYMNGFGNKINTRVDPVDDQTVFRLASVSKGFAGVLVGILADEGVLSLDDPVSKYVPEFTIGTKNHAKKLKIKHLLSHTTGLSYHTYTTLVEDGMSLDEMLLRFRKIEAATDTGKVYSYQNVIYSLIEKVVQSATGKCFSHLMAEKIFMPLGMSTASTCYNEMKKNHNIAYPHYYTGKSWRDKNISREYYNVIAAGGLNASINDMSKWLIAIMGNQPGVIGKDIMEKVFCPRVTTAIKWKYYKRWPFVNKVHYGLGWRILETDREDIIHHGGYANGYRAEIAFIPKEKIGICILVNGPAELANLSLPTFFSMYEQHVDSINIWENQQKILVNLMHGENAIAPIYNW